MLFQSAGFLFFFLPLFLLAMFVIPSGIPKSLTLLLFSYLFYSGGEPLFVLILLVSSLTDYSAALLIYNTDSILKKRILLLFSIAINISLLSFFKYAEWIIPGISPWLYSIGIPVPDNSYFRGFLIPAGISFYTFQSMSYTIDVYRNKIIPERSLLGFFNFVSYLPQLIAGPIERFNNLYPQLRNFFHGKLSANWSAGIDRISLGIIQKLLIADSCGLIVDGLVYGVGEHNFITAWMIAVGFGMQIYYDFAAYCHIAIGISIILGIRLSENFNSPYQAANIQEFWRRWHITLSNWFRDYLYIPLGGSHKGITRTFFNILVTFLIIGLWHGAGWNYILWGTLHGIFLGLYHLKIKMFPLFRINYLLSIMVTFIFVSYTWVPFRISDNFMIIDLWRTMSGLQGFSISIIPVADIIFLGIVTIATVIVPNASRRWPGRSGWLESAALMTVALFAVFNSPDVERFIYFQF